MVGLQKTQPDPSPALHDDDSVEYNVTHNMSIANIFKDFKEMRHCHDVVPSD